jgi:hypothetical protein
MIHHRWPSGLRLLWAAAVILSVGIANAQYGDSAQPETTHDVGGEPVCASFKTCKLPCGDGAVQKAETVQRRKRKRHRFGKKKGKWFTVPRRQRVSCLKDGKREGLVLNWRAGLLESQGMYKNDKLTHTTSFTPEGVIRSFSINHPNSRCPKKSTGYQVQCVGKGKTASCSQSRPTIDCYPAPVNDICQFDQRRDCGVPTTGSVDDADV